MPGTLSLLRKRWIELFNEDIDRVNKKWSKKIKSTRDAFKKDKLYISNNPRLRSRNNHTTTVRTINNTNAPTLQNLTVVQSNTSSMPSARKVLANHTPNVPMTTCFDQGAMFSSPPIHAPPVGTFNCQVPMNYYVPPNINPETIRHCLAPQNQATSMYFMDFE